MSTNVNAMRGGSCSYRMPVIKVSSKEKAFQNLKQILVELKGNTYETNMMMTTNRKRFSVDQG